MMGAKKLVDQIKDGTAKIQGNKVAGYYNVEKPGFGSDYNIQASVTFLFPK